MLSGKSTARNKHDLRRAMTQHLMFLYVNTFDVRVDAQLIKSYCTLAFLRFKKR